MKYIYASEKLGSAVLYAMRSTERLQQRLQGCYSIFHPLGHHDDYLPPDLRKRFSEMIQAWTRMPDPEGLRGTVAVTTDRMSDDEARKWLEEVFSLFNEIERREALESDKAQAVR
jgi:hypothetical protein